MRRPRNTLLIISLAGAIGIALPASLLIGFMWHQSLAIEEERLVLLSRELAQQTEAAIVDAKSLLETLNQRGLEACTTAHLLELQNEALARPHVRAIGYWQAAHRLCGAGLVQGQSLMPPEASRIYDTGVIAWWPGEATTAGDVALFLMRFGNHDVAIDPRLLVSPGRLDKTQVALWVEGMIMASFPDDAVLPQPAELPEGLQVDRPGARLISRVALGSLFPIDIVAVQSLEDFQDRYLPLAAGIGSAGLVLILVWLTLVWRYLNRQFSPQNALRAAIDGRRIETFYQPIIELSSGRCIGAEVLGRWREKNGTTISPEVFVPLAEKAGLGTRLTLAVLQNLLEDLSRWRAHDETLLYHLNLTEDDLVKPDFSHQLRRLMDQNGIQPATVALEITERALLDADSVRERVSELRTRGHAVAIDDFGTGFSSLSYLQTFELDTLKIDKAFVDSLNTQAVTSNVIEPIIELAKTLHLEIIAEGIESETQVDWLRAHGVACGQGYWYSRPMDADAFRDWILENNR